MNQDKQPEALRLADIVERLNVGVHSQAIAEEYSAAARELRRQHARIAELEAELAALKAAPAGVEKPAPPTFMTEDQACKWGWETVRKEVGTKGWTTADSFNYYGFYLWGWKHRAQYELQRASAKAAVLEELKAAPAAQAVEPVDIDPSQCAQDVFDNGVSVGLFDIPKATANAICACISAALGTRVDWHYIGGRVHMKALRATPPAPAQAGVRDALLMLIEAIEYTPLGLRQIKALTQARAAIAAPQAQDVQDATTQAVREVLAAVEELPRYNYGYKSDGESRYLRSYESPDGHFLDRAEVIAAIAASAKGGA